MKKFCCILFFLSFGACLWAQDNASNETVYLQIGENRSIAPALSELQSDPFLKFLDYDPNLPSGTFIGVTNQRPEKFDMVGIINQENRAKEMAKAKRLADINLPQTQIKKEEKSIRFSGNEDRTQLNSDIQNFNSPNNRNPFYQYHNSLYNNGMGRYTRPYYYNNRTYNY
ncbi:hypothetical protein [Zunongwangia sp.]|uniref:hypothetical protein n=1 Tax=Zunongwangia sp. TaxID=1965325 RepID=UPI003AA82C41